MARKKKETVDIDSIAVQEIKRRSYSVDLIKVGDTVFLDEYDKVSYTVLDVGNPFVLILNDMTNFASLYKCTKLYKNE